MSGLSVRSVGTLLLLAAIAPLLVGCNEPESAGGAVTVAPGLGAGEAVGAEVGVAWA